MTNFTGTLLKTSTNSTRDSLNQDTINTPTISLKRIDGANQPSSSGNEKQQELAGIYSIPSSPTSTSSKSPFITTTTTTTTITTTTTTLNNVDGDSCSSVCSSVSSTPNESSFMSFFNLYGLFQQQQQQQQQHNINSFDSISNGASSTKSTASEINLINYNNQYIPSSEFQNHVEKESQQRNHSLTVLSVEKVSLKQRFQYFLNWLIHQIKTSTWKSWLKFSVFIFVVVGICLAIFVFKVQNHLMILQEFVNKFGTGLGGLVFMGVFILLIVFLIPVTIPTIIAGIIFKPYFGVLFVWGASVIGGTISFILGRYVFRKSIVKKIEKNKKLLVVDQVIGQEGWKIVLLLRFTPIIPESLLNYALAVTRISFRHYIICSSIGLIPGVSFFIYIGSMIGSISEIGKKQTKGEIAMYVISGVVMVFTILFILIIVRRAVNKKLEQEENKGLLDEEERNGQDYQDDQSDLSILNGDESSIN